MAYDRSRWLTAGVYMYLVAKTIGILVSNHSMIAKGALTHLGFEKSFKCHRFFLLRYYFEDPSIPVKSYS